MKDRLLILTQTVDKKDRELGFFHQWVVEFAKQSNPLTVICLKRGVYDLPDHVKVLTLGKENMPEMDKGKKRLRYIYRFYKYIWQERNNYDAVFVHMNEEYVLLGAIIWKLLGKRVTMWRNHLQGTRFTSLAVSMCEKVFCTSPKSFTARFEKTKIMPAGVDIELYSQASLKSEKNSILFFGRLSPVKNVHVFIESLSALDASGFDFRADIIGSPANPEDVEYERTLHQLGEDLVAKGKLMFKKGVPHEETVSLYGKYSLYVNLTPDGSFDKTMLEGMASRIPVLVSNSVFRGQIPENCQLTSLEAGSASEKIKALLLLNDIERADLGISLAKYAEEVHGLSHLVQMLKLEIVG